MPGRPGIIAMALAVSLTAGAFASAAAGAPWSFGVGGALVGGYDPSGYATGFPGAWLVDASVERAVGRMLRVRGEFSYLDFSGTQSGTSLDPDQRATFVPVGLGLRLQSVSGASGVAAYADFVPTLFVVRWKDDAEMSGVNGEWGATAASRFTRGVPGLRMGCGIVIRGDEHTSIDLGLQWSRSMQIRSEASGERPLAPLSNGGLAIGFSFHPGGD